jgi:hypothetical protein
MMLLKFQKISSKKITHLLYSYRTAAGLWLCSPSPPIVGSSSLVTSSRSSGVDESQRSQRVASSTRRRVQRLGYRRRPSHNSHVPRARDACRRRRERRVQSLSRVFACACGFSRRPVLFLLFLIYRLDPSRGSHELEAGNDSLLGQILILPSVYMPGVGPCLIGGPGRPPRLPVSRARPASQQQANQATSYAVLNLCFLWPVRILV